VASIIRTDVRTIRRWIDDGLIAALKLPGGHWRIARSEVERIQRDGFNRPPKAKKEAAA
jgi:excisionase family DNA binding protein